MLSRMLTPRAVVRDARRLTTRMQANCVNAFSAKVTMCVGTSMATAGFGARIEDDEDVRFASQDPVSGGIRPLQGVKFRARGREARRRENSWRREEATGRQSGRERKCE